MRRRHSLLLLPFHIPYNLQIFNCGVGFEGAACPLTRSGNKVRCDTHTHTCWTRCRLQRGENVFVLFIKRQFKSPALPRQQQQRTVWSNKMWRFVLWYAFVICCIDTAVRPSVKVFGVGEESNQWLITEWGGRKKKTSGISPIFLPLVCF